MSMKGDILSTLKVATCCVCYDDCTPRGCTTCKEGTTCAPCHYKILFFQGQGLTYKCPICSSSYNVFNSKKEKRFAKSAFHKIRKMIVALKIILRTI